ncbi:MAG: M14 family metallopeptidase [Ilumatobacter sp.]
MTDQSDIDTPRLDATYAVARQRFLDAAERSGATVRTTVHPLTGREGEELAIDVAVLGPSDADTTVLVVSGTHGVEGYAGSALQHWWLEERAAQRPADVRVVLIHSMNPVGFSWVRRVNEDNVDLNRNFVDWTQPPPANDAYGDIADVLVPERWDDDTQTSTTAQLLEVAADVGLERFQEIVSSGQYDHPTGIFHGGRGPTWSHRWVVDNLAALAGSADRVAIIDLHTGLGPWSHGELISHEASDAPGYRRGTQWWGEVRSMQDGESVSANLTGDWLAAADSLLPDAEVTAVALEFGTVDVITVLQSLRADAWMHAHGDPTATAAAEIRAQVRAAFADDDPAWLAALIERFDDVSSGALGALSNAGMPQRS